MNCAISSQTFRIKNELCKKLEKNLFWQSFVGGVWGTVLYLATFYLFVRQISDFNVKHSLFAFIHSWKRLLRTWKRSKAMLVVTHFHFLVFLPMFLNTKEAITTSWFCCHWSPLLLSSLLFRSSLFKIWPTIYIQLLEVLLFSTKPIKQVFKIDCSIWLCVATGLGMRFIWTLGKVGTTKSWLVGWNSNILQFLYKSFFHSLSLLCYPEQSWISLSTYSSFHSPTTSAFLKFSWE